MNGLSQYEHTEPILEIDIVDLFIILNCCNVNNPNFVNLS